MKLAEFRFRLVCGEWWYDRSEDLDLCAEGVRKFWEVPKRARVLWVQLHDKPNGYRYRLDLDRTDPDDPAIFVDGARVEVDDVIYDRLKSLLKKHKNIHAEVWFQ